ncbi:MAG: Putative outer membrane lipoprotein [uncultured Sulfurovum sp.]|uniref:Outer membrane lipoprotein n=1 Tax=uncultured Sulfurovum sp. TaxID=269237 RepID=A0A6S6TW88_9BACT|nr:MAG: Putative outer membrane lipoprotein [uncultured Sulfurovum sp.]
MKIVHSVLLAGLMLTTSINADTKENKLGVNVGVTSIYNEDSIEMDNLSAGVTYQFNEVRSEVKPRIDLDYVKIKDYKEVSSLIKGSVNGVYELSEDYVVTPYVMAGVGYEVVTDSIEGEFDSRAFAQGGVGAVYHQEDGYDVNVEAKALQVFGSDNQDNEIIVTAGVAVPVGTIGTYPQDKDECPIKIDEPDEDRDGVADVVDQCPQTPCYFTVDEYGCPIKATLRIHFDVDKATIRPHSMPKVEEFAAFLAANKGSMVKIDGHTDSDADDAYNMILSEARANTVMNKIVELGVSQNRLTAEGKGETSPTTSNATEAGKQLNRRIEVTLTYPTK